MELFLQLLFLGLFVLLGLAFSGLVGLLWRGLLRWNVLPSVMTFVVLLVGVLGFAYVPPLQGLVALHGWLMSLLVLLVVLLQAWFFPLGGDGAARRVRVSLKILTFLAFFIVLCVGVSVR